MSSEPNQPTPQAPEPLPPLPSMPPSTPPGWSPAPLPTPTLRKSPGLAVVLSFFPGLGHLYLGLYQRGIAFFVAFAAAIVLSDKADLGILIPFAWFFAVIDAYRQTQFINLGYVPEPYPGEVARKAARRGNLGFGVFLVLIGAILLYNQFYPIDLSFLADWWPMLFVLAGAYLIARHFIDREKARRAEIERNEQF